VEWSEQQKAIFKATSNRDRNLVVRARAGTGKTTTAIAALEHAPPGGKVITAFNRHIAAELKRRVYNPDGDIDVKTLHGLGLATIGRTFGRGIEVDPDKGIQIARKVAATVPEPKDDEARQVYKELPRALKHLAGLFKNAQPADLKEARRMVYAFDCYNQHFPASQMAELAARCLQLAAQERYRIDYDDMIYFPRKFNLVPAPHSLVVIDELQDMNRGQLHLVLGAGRRIIAIGDEKQAIYRWRGADSKAMKRVIEALDAEVLPLSTTYRCDRAIVEYVKTTLFGLGDFQARDDAGDGKVYEVEHDELDPRPGDYVLSRWNAPLVRHALDAANEGHKVCVVGSDIAKRLSGMLRDSKLQDPGQVPAWATEQANGEAETMREEARDDQIPAMLDRYSVLMSMSEHATSMSHLRTIIRTLFTDTPSGRAVTFSTVHKAKGHERDRVWLLMEGIKEPGKNEEEDNIHYVAATRAKHELVLVQPRPKVPGRDWSLFHDPEEF
jgi:superfamily I DNA/RNA helicase